MLTVIFLTMKIFFLPEEDQHVKMEVSVTRKAAIKRLFYSNHAGNPVQIFSLCIIWPALNLFLLIN